MAVTEQQRHDLFLWLEEQMGKERSATMIELILSGGSDNLATKADLAGVRDEVADLRGEVTEVRDEVADLRAGLAEVRTEMAEMRGDLRTEMAELRGEMRVGLADLRSSLLRSFSAWLVTSQAAVITVVAVLLTALR